MKMTPESLDIFLSWGAVVRTVGLSKTTIWRLTRKQQFPRPCKISDGRVGFSASEVQAWIADRKAGR